MVHSERMVRLGWTLGLRKRYQLRMIAAMRSDDAASYVQAKERRERAIGWAGRYRTR